MPARDIHHEVVVQALTADGWIITHDPLRLAYGARDVYVDLAAELPIAAERDGQRIAVEVFQEPIGQLMIETQSLRLLVFDPEIGRINRWTP